IAGRRDRLMPVVDSDGALVAVVEIEVRPSHADCRTELDENVRPDLSLTIIEYGKIGSADSFHDGLEHGTVRHIGIRVDRPNAIRAEHDLQIVTEIPGDGRRESVPDKYTHLPRASNA